MGYTTLDISTAVFPTGTGRLDSGAIVSNTTGDSPEWVIPGFALTPGKFYEIVLSYATYDPHDTAPYAWLAPTDPSESYPSYYFLGDAAGDDSGDPQDIHIFIGPGINDWDSFIPAGYNHVRFNGDPDLRITAIKWQNVTLSDWSDWLDDAPDVWVFRNSVPSPAVYKVDSLDSTHGSATQQRAWDGTGNTPTTDTSSYFRSGFGFAAAYNSPDPFGCLWSQEWVTIKRSATEPGASSGVLPAPVATNPLLATVEWEPSTDPVDHRIHVLVSASKVYATETHIKLVAGLTYGDPLYSPGFVSGSSMAGMADAVVLPMTYGGAEPAMADGVIDGATLIAAGIPLTGAVQAAVAPVDEWTQSQVWSYGVPAGNVAFRSRPFFETAYHLRYRAKYWIPAGGTSVPPRRLYPRDTNDGPGIGRSYPPPTTQQAGRRFGAGAPV